MHRVALAILVALALLAGACGKDQDPSVASGATTTVGGGAQTTSAPASSVSPATTPTGSPITTFAPEDVPDASHDASGPPGSAAPLFLRPQPAKVIVVEVSSNRGTGPQKETLDHILGVLSDVSGKSISATGGSIPPEHDAWTAADVRAAASSGQSGDVAVLRLLFLHGRWADDDHVLGISVRADLAAIFVDQVASAADPLVGPTAIEVAVTTHEVGHLLGLVDLYLDTGRDDPQHPGHSTNKKSVMYWAVESSLVTDLLSGGPPRDFDDADKADLARIRGGA